MPSAISLRRPGGLATTVVFAIMVMAADLHAGPPPWRMLVTPQFTVVSQLADKPTREWAEEFNQFIEELRRVFQTERPHLPPLTVVMFARDRDFRRYKPLRPDGRKPAAIAGFFNHHGNWSVIGVADRYTEKETRELIFHEGVHWFMSTDPVVYPVWLSEGMAEVFSTFAQERGSVRWGLDIGAHVQQLRTETMLPFERFLFLTRDDPLFNERDRTGIFYAQSWVFVHYLMFGEREGSRSAIGDYFTTLTTETHPDEAFRQAFGQDYARMSQTLASYIRTGRYYKVSRAESPAARLTAPTVVAPAAVVEVALARLAIAAQRYDIARPHAERAVALAPDEPGGYEMLAQLCDRAGDDAGALAACERAEQCGSQDASTLFLLAYRSAAREMAAGGISGATAGFVASLYRRTITLSPTMVEAYQNLAAVAPSLTHVDDEDLAALKQGARLFSRRGDIVLGLAAMVARRGDDATARVLVAEARRRGLPIEEERRATRMEETWLHNEVLTRINGLANAGDYAGAVAVCNEAAAAVSDVHLRGSLLRMRQSLASRAQLAEAEGALRAGDTATARRLFEALLAESGSSNPALRRHVEDVLRRLRPVAEVP